MVIAAAAVAADITINTFTIRRMIMKKSLRILSLVLGIMLVIGMLSGCKKPASSDKSGDTGDGSVEMELTMFEWGWEGPGEGMDEVAPEIEKRTGVKINLNRWIITSDEDHKRQLSLWASSDDFPEVLCIPTDGYSVDMMNQLGEAGKLWEVDGIVEKIIPEAQEMLRNSMEYYKHPSNGKYYIYPTQNNDYDAMIAMDNIAQEGLIIRKEWLDRLGVGYPGTPDELYEVLKRFRDEIKDFNGQPVIPVLLNENMGGAEQLAKMFFDVSDRMSGYFNMFRELPDGTYTNAPDQKKLENFLLYLNKLYREGLLDKEAATIKDSQYQEKMNSGRVGLSGTAWWNMNTYNDTIKAVDPEAFYAFMPIPKGEGVTNPVQQFIFAGAPCAFVFSKSMDQAKFDKVVDLFAYMSTQEGLILSWFGLEDIHWEKNEEGKIKFTQKFLDETGGGDWNKGAQRGIGYYVGLAAKVGVIDPLIVPYEYLSRYDVVESRKNLQGTIFKADQPQDLVPPGPIQNQKLPAIGSAFNELIVNATIATTEDECRELINGWPATWEALGGKEIETEKTELVKNAQK
jgi:putative aldouronate transport system substrate-binding protein